MFQVKHHVKTQLTLSSAGSSGGEGRRTHIQVLANSLVASLLILLHYRQLLARDKSGDASQGCWPYASDLLVVGIVRFVVFSVATMNAFNVSTADPSATVIMRQ